MSIATKVAALLVAVRRQDVEELSPVERQRLANLCRYVASLAEPQVAQVGAPPRSGVLDDLKSGRRAE
jgi:hypothetical protein